MSTLRIYRSEVSTPPKLRVYRSAVAGTAPTTPKLRIYRSAVGGASATVLAPFTSPVDAESFVPYTVNAVVAAGSPTPDSYTWRVLPGSAPVTIVGSGASVTIMTPALNVVGGAFCDIGVRAVKDGVSSAERVVRIRTPFHQYFRITAAGLKPYRRVSL